MGLLLVVGWRAQGRTRGSVAAVRLVDGRVGDACLVVYVTQAFLFFLFWVGMVEVGFGGAGLCYRLLAFFVCLWVVERSTVIAVDEIVGE